MSFTAFTGLCVRKPLSLEFKFLLSSSFSRAIERRYTVSSPVEQYSLQPRYIVVDLVVEVSQLLLPHCI